MDVQTLTEESNGTTNGHAPGTSLAEELLADTPIEATEPSVTPDAAADAGVGQLPAVLESLLFAAGQPVTLAKLVEALGGPGKAEVQRALEVLAAGYERDGRGLRLLQVAGGWQLRTAPAHAPWVRRLLQERPPRLSRPMLETLAIVAYRQPCTRIEVEAIRGVDCDAVLQTLTERRMVKIVGRKDAPGRPLLYGTTKEFLEIFGLQDLTALPTLRELGDGAAEILAAPDLTVTEAGVLPTPASDEPPGEDG